jgi:hypothetical protein
MKLNQVIAIEKGEKTTRNDVITKGYHMLQKHELLAGIAKSYQPFEDGEEHELPSEVKNVQIKAKDIFEATLEAFANFINITATKDWANCEAKADIELEDGTVLVTGIPVTHLLFLEKQLVDLHTVIEKLPVLDVAESWTYDANKGVFETPAAETVRNKKVLRVLIKYEATDKHPAQTETYNEDVPQGKWSTVKFSGALPADDIRQLLNRVENLQRAVKLAREKANMGDVTEITVGNTLMSYVLEGTN